jgi:hypothetical protein
MYQMSEATKFIQGENIIVRDYCGTCIGEILSHLAQQTPMPGFSDGKGLVYTPGN